MRIKKITAIIITGIMLTAAAGCSKNSVKAAVPAENIAVASTINKTEASTDTPGKAAPAADNPAALSTGTTQKTSENEINLTKLKITLPTGWTQSGIDELFFIDKNGNTLGGISLVGFYGEYNPALPNHSSILKAEDINTPLGIGKLFTLERDHPAAENNNEVWTEIHAVIPITGNNMAYDIWVKSDKSTLLNILKSIH